jgi:HD-like signal output (HDOD) protein
MVSAPLCKRFEMQSLVVYAAKLPPAPQVFGRLVAAIDDGDCSLDRMAELVRLDASITAQLLRVANSVVFGFRTQATSAEEAVLRVGLKELHRIVGLCAAAATFQSDMAVYATNSGRLWTNAVTTAVAMERLCQATGADAALGYTAGLIRSIGKMVLARHAAGAVAPYPDDGTPLPEWETRVFGCQHAQVGAALCELWRFPKPIGGAIRDHLWPANNPMCAVTACLLNLAGRIATGLDCGLPGEAMLWSDQTACFEKTGLDEARVVAIVEETRLEVARMKSVLEVIRPR